MINNKIGNITSVKWHYVNYKYALNFWGYMRETFDANMYIVKEMVEIEDKQGNITNTYPFRNFDESMLKDKKYAYVYLQEGKIFIRNLFDSSNDKGFKQKNTFFEDEISGRFLLDDTNNMLLSYLNLGYQDGIQSLDDTGIISPREIVHYCVEYEVYENVGMFGLEYCVKLESEIKSLNERLKQVEKIVEEKLLNNDVKKNTNNKWFNLL